jgi:hypothetical protein
MVRVGQKGVVSSSAFDSQVEGVVSYVGAVLGEQTRTARARVSLANPRGAWRPGLFVTVAVLRDRQAGRRLPTRVGGIENRGEEAIEYGLLRLTAHRQQRRDQCRQRQLAAARERFGMRGVARELRELVRGDALGQSER